MNILIIGIGNEFRRDDGAGLIMARKLKAKNLNGVTVVEESGEGASLMERWKEFDSVMLLDAVESGAKPGTVHSFEAHREKLPAQFFHYSTHAFSVAEAVEVARALEQLPLRVMVYGIEGSDFSAGRGLTEAVDAAIGGALKKVMDRVQQWTMEQEKKHA